MRIENIYREKRGEGNLQKIAKTVCESYGECLEKSLEDWEYADFAKMSTIAKFSKISLIKTSHFHTVRVSKRNFDIMEKVGYFAQNSQITILDNFLRVLIIAVDISWFCRTGVSGDLQQGGRFVCMPLCDVRKTRLQTVLRKLLRNWRLQTLSFCAYKVREARQIRENREWNSTDLIVPLILYFYFRRKFVIVIVILHQITHRSSPSCPSCIHKHLMNCDGTFFEAPTDFYPWNPNFYLSEMKTRVKPKF